MSAPFTLLLSKSKSPNQFNPRDHNYFEGSQLEIIAKYSEVGRSDDTISRAIFFIRIPFPLVSCELCTFSNRLRLSSISATMGFKGKAGGGGGGAPGKAKDANRKKMAKQAMRQRVTEREDELRSQRSASEKITAMKRKREPTQKAMAPGLDKVYADKQRKFDKKGGSSDAKKRKVDAPPEKPLNRKEVCTVALFPPILPLPWNLD